VTNPNPGRAKINYDDHPTNCRMNMASFGTERILHLKLSPTDGQVNCLVWDGDGDGMVRD